AGRPGMGSWGNPLDDVTRALEIIVDQPALFTPDDLLLLEVRADDELLSDGLGAYSARAGVFIPLGEVSRLLDVAITVDPVKRRAEGWVGSPDNTVLLDLRTRQGRANRRELSVTHTNVAFFDDEIYV